MTNSYGHRVVRWHEFVQRVRAHRPTELLRALATIAAAEFTGRLVTPRRSGWSPWAIAAVARESIAYGNEYRSVPVTSRALDRILKAYDDLEDPLVTGGEHGGVWDVILRLVYQQFDISKFVFPELARFAALFDRPFPSDKYKVFSTEALSELLGAPVLDYLGATFLFTVGAQKNAGKFDLAWLAQPQFEPVVEVISAETLTHILKGTLAAPLDHMRAAAKTARNRDPALRIHDFNPLIATPYVGLTTTEFLAPLPRLVAGKASVTAVYHLGYSHIGHSFTSDLGYLIESYAGDQLHLIPGAVITPEREYATGRKSVDWIVVLPDAVVLVEVKSARVNQAARLNITAYQEDVKADVGKALAQISRTANLIRAGHAAFADIPTDRPVRGLVVTAEPHYLINSPIYREGMPDPTVPTVVMSLDELESMAGFCLARYPGEVVLTLTDWAPNNPVNVTSIQNAWYSQSRKLPPNPILNEAWNRMPWKDAVALT